ncbi:MAG: Ser/Thr protein kinase RdoA (MazF antagonist)/murein DD-endopeptidase MepM, partial [Polaribacter sp.]
MNAIKAEKILLELYHIEGNAFKLPGEIDLNFKIKVGEKTTHILKISKHSSDEELDFQQSILQYLHKKDESSNTPKVVLDKNKNSISKLILDDESTLKVRLLSWIDGRVWSSVNPQLTDLRFSLGEKAGKIANNLQDFHHPKAERIFDWDIAQGAWIKDYLHLFKNEEKATISYFLNKFEAFQDEFQNLRKSVVHNDANDNNVLVSEDLIHPKVTAIIDFGDAIKTQIINDVAITCCYAMMHHEDPLEASLPIIKGYHTAFPLEEKELKFLYVLIAIRLIISVTKSAINKIEHPENEYLLISEKPAWSVLKKWIHVSEDFAHFSFRNTCSYRAHPNQQKFENWTKENTFSLSELFPTINRTEIHHLDLSVASAFVGHQKEFNNLDLFQFKIDQLQKEVPTKILAGGYLEPRNLYTSTEYDTIGNCGKQSRTIHLGIDFWLPENTPVHALFDGEVVIVENDIGDKEYGGLIVLKHQLKDFCFYTLYGHNTAASVLRHQIGNTIKKGEQVAVLANYPENGNWAPHLHFQVMLSLLDYKNDFPGVAYFNQIDVWKSVCPDPNLLFKLDGFKENLIDYSNEIITKRKNHLGKGMSLQY